MILPCLLFCGWLCLAAKCVQAKGFGHDLEAKPESKMDTGVKTGDQSPVSVWNFNFQTVSQTAGYGLPLTLLGWGASFLRSRKLGQGLQAVVESIEESQCKDCKAKVRNRCNRWLNKHVAKLTKRG